MRGRGALCKRRNDSGSGRGVYRSENAGMSSANDVRIIMAGNLRFLEEGSSSQGKSGPKPRARAVGDGQQVYIPALPTE